MKALRWRKSLENGEESLRQRGGCKSSQARIQIDYTRIQIQIFLTPKTMPESSIPVVFFQTSGSNPLEGQEINLLDEDQPYRMKTSTLILMYENTE